MRKEQRLRSRSEFARVQREGRRWANPLLVLRALPNQRQVSRFGFLVSRRIGTAVVRNRVKRRLREIARREPVKQGWDLVFVARNDIGEASFAEVQQALRDLLRRGHIREAPPERHGS